MIDPTTMVLLFNHLLEFVSVLFEVVKFLHSEVSFSLAGRVIHLMKLCRQRTIIT